MAAKKSLPSTGCKITHAHPCLQVRLWDTGGIAFAIIGQSIEIPISRLPNLRSRCYSLSGAGGNYTELPTFIVVVFKREEL